MAARTRAAKTPAAPSNDDVLKMAIVQFLRDAPHGILVALVARELQITEELAKRLLDDLVHSGLAQVHDNGTYSPCKPKEPWEEGLQVIQDLDSLLNHPQGLVQVSMSAPRDEHVVVNIQSPGYRVTIRKVRSAHVTVLKLGQPYPTGPGDEVIEAIPKWGGIIEVTLECPSLGDPIVRKGHKVVLVTNPL